MIQNSQEQKLKLNYSHHADPIQTPTSSIIVYAHAYGGWKIA